MPARSSRRAVSLAALCLFHAASVAALGAQVDLERARAELEQVFVRPAGTRIADAQRQALADFLARYAGQDLGPLAYANALQRYLERDMPGAADALDGFFAHHETIANTEHRNMAGRVYLASLAGAARDAKLDEARLRARATQLTRLYDDLGTVARVTAPLLADDSKVQDRAGLRVALLRGALSRTLSRTPAQDDAATRPTDAAVDAFAAALYAGAEPPARAVAATRLRPTPVAAPGGKPADLVGEAAPSWTATHVIDNRAAKVDKLALDDLRGKVVVLDFFATWCAPCRAVVPHLVELQAKHHDVAVIGVTRFYGRGMDFAADAEKPHGGTAAAGLDQAAELAVNRRFATAFALNYPLAFVDAAVAASHHVTGIPTVFVLDRGGKVVGAVVGGDAAKIDELVAKALAQ